MPFLFQRLAPNGATWMAPTADRLGEPDGGDYLRTRGFAHEDWNFLLETATDRRVHGYMYYRPKNSDGPFHILFATYDKLNGWLLVGHYKNAQFDLNGANFREATISRRARELWALSQQGHLGREYKAASEAKIKKLLREESQGYRWHVSKKDVHFFQTPVSVPAGLTKDFGKYFTTPNIISKSQWQRFIALGKTPDRKPKNDYADGGDTEFPEGKKVQRMHFGRERSVKLVRDAKRAFKERNGRLFCEVCAFDFAHTYGPAGSGFIEAHHIKAVSKLGSKAKSKMSDLAMVCANCHRMLHRQRPWKTPQQLRKTMKRR